MCACMPVPREARVMDPLELELQVIVSFETRYWEHQSGCLREEYKFLTADPYFHHENLSLFCHIINILFGWTSLQNSATKLFCFVFPNDPTTVTVRSVDPGEWIA